MLDEIKAIKIEETIQRNFIEVALTGKLDTEDYKTFVPELDRFIEQNKKLLMLVKLIDFQGWTPGALWEDTKFAFRHFNHIQKIAVVGDKKWEKGMIIFCQPFTTAKVRYFDLSRIAQARDWLESDIAD